LAHFSQPRDSHCPEFATCMSDIFSITLPIFLIIGLGYLCIGLKLFTKPEVRTLGTFVLMVALPALIIRALSQRTIAEVLDVNYLIAFALGSLFSMLVGLAVAHWVLKSPLETSAITGLGMSSSNSGFVGYPLAVLVIGPMASVALALNMLVENALIIPLALALAEISQDKGQGFGLIARGMVLRLVRSPMIIAIVLGLTVSILGIHLPTPVVRTVDMLAMASGPVALFVIGATLHGLRLGGMAGNLSLIVLGKLVLHPLAVLLALLAFPVRNPDLHTGAILMAAVPMLSIYPVLGQRFGQEKLCSAALLGATVMSFVTLSGVLLLLRV
jgi:predicted permease